MFTPKAEQEKEEKPEKKPAMPKSQKGPYRESEIQDPDELKAAHEELEQSGRFDFVGNFTDNVAVVREKQGKKSANKMCLVNKEGEIISEKFTAITEFKDGMARVDDIEKGYAFINTKGEIMSEWYELIKLPGFKNGFAVVMKDSKWFFIDKNLKKREELGEWERIGDFSKGSWMGDKLEEINGFAWVKKDGKWIAIDNDGNVLTALEEIKEKEAGR